jgi:GT2 family glycosyltransferase
MASKRASLIPAPAKVSLESTEVRLLANEKRQAVTSVTAVIPTLNRYDYLPKAIDSLLNQSPPPQQIIVVDQTTVEQRQLDLYVQYEDEPVEVIFLDQAGQSLARNAALRAAKSEWILFFDDDSVAWEGLIAEHIKTIECSGAQASTGVSLAPWKNKSHIPQGFQHYHLTNVLDTGNSLVQRAAIYHVGGLDRAFDKGSGADNDLGTRLHIGGYEIVFNPQAIRTHHKALKGGLRTHGAWWRQKSETWAPFPPPTQVYTVRQFYPKTHWIALYLLFYFRARRHHSVSAMLWLWLALPWKLAQALRVANQLKTNYGLKNIAQGQ